MARTTIYDYIQAAAKEIGVLAEGQVLSASQASDGLDCANALFDQWAAERLAIYQITRGSFNIVPNQQEYLIGTPDATLLTNGDFETPIVTTVPGWSRTSAVVYGYDTVTVRSGTNSLKVSGIAGTGYAYQTFAVLPAQVHNLTAYAQVLTGLTTCAIYLQDVTTGLYLQTNMSWGATRTNFGGTFAGIGSWGSASATFTTTDITLSLQLQLECTGGGVFAAYWDDVSVIPQRIARPVSIDHVTYVNTAVSPAIELPLNPITEDGWADLTLKQMSSVLPNAWYYSPTFPYGSLRLWPTPTGSSLLFVIYAPEAVGQFATLTTPLSLPPAYGRMVVKNLALDLAPQYEREPSPLLVAQAAKTLEVVKAANHRIREMSFGADALVGNTPGGAYDIRVGP